MKFNLIMKRLYIITIVLIAALTQSSWTYGQPPGDRGEKMQAMRISFITGELALTPAEAQVFWPVFNKFGREPDKIGAMAHNTTTQSQIEPNTKPSSRKTMQKCTPPPPKKKVYT